MHYECGMWLKNKMFWNDTKTGVHRTNEMTINKRIAASFSHTLCKSCSLQNTALEGETEREGERPLVFSLSLSAASVISHDMSFLMDFLIFVCEVIWYVSIWLWLAPHGAGDWWSGCSCANITLFCPQQSQYSTASCFFFHSWQRRQTSGRIFGPTTVYPVVEFLNICDKLFLQNVMLQTKSEISQIAALATLLLLAACRQ